MKLDEVPQDEAYLIEGKIRDLCYVVDKDGHYTRALSKGWTPKNEAMKLAWDQIYEHAGGNPPAGIGRKIKSDCLLYGIECHGCYYFGQLYGNFRNGKSGDI